MKGGAVRLLAVEVKLPEGDFFPVVSDQFLLAKGSVAPTSLRYLNRPLADILSYNLPGC